MKLKQLKCFHAVATLGSFTAASRSLGTTQPSITNNIRALEDRFGVELFNRDRSRVKLTDTGRRLLSVTRRMLSLENEASDILLTAGGLKSGKLKVDTASPYQVMELVLEFCRLHPDIELSVSVNNSQQAMTSLLELECDIAILAQNEKDSRVVTVPLSRDRLIVFVNRDHPWFGRKNIKLKDLEGQRVVLREVGSMTRWAFESALAQRNINIHVALEIGGYEAVHEAVLNEVGIGVVLKNEYVASVDLAPLEISDTEIFVDVYVAYLKNRQRSPLINGVLAAVKNIATRSEPA